MNTATQLISETTAPPRPTLTWDMKLAAAQQLCERSDLLSDIDPDVIATQYAFRMDGYELARALENFACEDIDREMMEELDGMDSICRSLVKEAEKAWFIEHNIQPPFPDGTPVTIPRQNISGVIDGIYEYGVAQYKVREDGLEESNTRRMIVPFESVTLRPVDE